MIFLLFNVEFDDFEFDFSDFDDALLFDFEGGWLFFFLHDGSHKL